MDKKCRLMQQTGFLFLLILIFTVAPVYGQVDSSYIRFYEHESSIRPYFSDKYTSLIHNLGDNDEAIYRPNAPFGIGLGVSYKNYSISGGYGFDFMRDKKKGKTKSLDFQYHYYGRRFVTDIFFQRYKGLYTEPKEGEYNFYSDIKLVQYGAFSQYIFNGNKFSYQAAYDQNEKQIKSAGSFLLGGGIYFNQAESAGSLMFNNDYKIKNFQFGVSAGYAYTWVINKYVYLSGSMSFGINVGAKGFDRFGKDRLEVYPTMFPRFSAGYDRNDWSIGLSAINNVVYIIYSKENEMMFNTGAIQLSFVKRFTTLPGFLQKRKR